MLTVRDRIRLRAQALATLMPSAEKDIFLGVDMKRENDKDCVIKVWGNRENRWNVDP